MPQVNDADSQRIQRNFWLPDSGRPTFGQMLAASLIVIICAILVWPAFQRPPLYQGTRRNWSRDNLKLFGLATHNYHDIAGHLTHDVRNPENARPLHGWMTSLLPYLEHQQLYQQIDWNLPWDDPSQRELFCEPIGEFAYVSPLVPPLLPGELAVTTYSGNVHVLGANPPLRFSQISDGESNTIFLGEIRTNFPAWGAPGNTRDPALGINSSILGFGSPWTLGANFLLGDGSARFLSNKIDPQVLRALATPAGNETIPEDVEW